MSDIRWNLVNHIREQIRAGTYETTGKYRIVCDRILEGSRAPDVPPGTEREDVMTPKDARNS